MPAKQGEAEGKKADPTGATTEEAAVKEETTEEAAVADSAEMAVVADKQLLNN